MSASEHLLLEIDAQECRRLLATTGLGRLGFTERALPMILPVHFTVHGDEIVISSISDAKTDAARRGTVVVFEVDDYDPVTREGWTVSVVGLSRLITDPAETDALDALGFAPWHGHPRQTYVGIHFGLLQGRRLVTSSTRAAFAGSALASEA